ncbi:MAG: glycosyltransferase family 39 protein [Chloroflexi bacterium]|nr:glycosyltransferase family 39 protein [Chloroflexota bacterium]
MQAGTSSSRGIIGLDARTALWLSAIVALALLLRLAWLARTDTVLLPLSDPQYYHATAQNLAEGRGYSVTVDQRGFVAGDKSEGTAFWPPGYSFALAPLYKLFGSDIGVAKVFNAIAGALTVLPVFYLGRRLRGDAAGLLAAALFAVAPSLVFWTASLFSEPLFTLGIASTLAVAAWAADRRSIGAYLLAGLVLAATGFVRSQGMLMVVPAAVLLVRDVNPRALLRIALPAAAGVALLVVPWTIRNQAVMGRAYPINDNLGYNLRLAHGPYSKGTSVPPQDLWDERPGISFKERELFFDDEGRSRALTYAREHPGRELELAVRRIGYLSRSDAEASVRWSESLGLTPISGRGFFVLIGDLWYYPVLLLALASLVALPRSRIWLALWSALAVWGALHLVFAGEPRYHVPLLPVVVVLAAAVILRLFESLNTEEAAAP